MENKTSPFIGLPVGMASAMLILLWIQNEVSHDRFYKNIDRIYTLNNRDKFNGVMFAWNTTPKILAPTVKQNYPDVEQAIELLSGVFYFQSVISTLMNQAFFQIRRVYFFAVRLLCYFTYMNTIFLR